jgi:hypothetical protein
MTDPQGTERVERGNGEAFVFVLRHDCGCELGMWAFVDFFWIGMLWVELLVSFRKYLLLFCVIIKGGSWR